MCRRLQAEAQIGPRQLANRFSILLGKCGGRGRKKEQVARLALLGRGYSQSIQLGEAQDPAPEKATLMGPELPGSSLAARVLDPGSIQRVRQLLGTNWAAHRGVREPRRDRGAAPHPPGRRRGRSAR